MQDGVFSVTSLDIGEAGRLCSSLSRGCTKPFKGRERGRLIGANQTSLIALGSLVSLRLTGRIDFPPKKASARPLRSPLRPGHNSQAGPEERQH